VIHITSQEALQTISDITIKIEKAHDEMMKEFKTGFKPTLINLKIEDFHIKEPNGIMPIADNLEKRIINIQNIINTLILENRDKLNEAIKVLSIELNK
jgi:hypothetical protein